MEGNCNHHLLARRGLKGLLVMFGLLVALLVLAIYLCKILLFNPYLSMYNNFVRYILMFYSIHFDVQLLSM